MRWIEEVIENITSLPPKISPFVVEQAGAGSRAVLEIGLFEALTENEEGKERRVRTFKILKTYVINPRQSYREPILYIIKPKGYVRLTYCLRRSSLLFLQIMSTLAKSQAAAPTNNGQFRKCAFSHMARRMWFISFTHSLLHSYFIRFFENSLLDSL
jgi:hypothetical protein